MKAEKFVKIAAVSAALIMSLSLTGCKKTAPKADEEDEKVAFAVITQRITESNLDDYLEFGGNIVASSLVNILPDASGKISRLMVKVGDVVQKDQVVAYIDPSRPGMTYSASPVKAPVKGTVTLFPYTVGEQVGTSTSIGQIGSTGKLEIHTHIAERFVSRIKNGQAATISFDAFPGETFSAHVFEVSPVLDTATRTMQIKLNLDSTDPRIKVGMYSKVRLITDKRENAMAIPFDAIVTRDGETFVFVVKRTGNENSSTGFPGIVSKQNVTLGIHVDDKVEILSGLKAGDEIVVRGQSVLAEGSPVNIVSSK